MLAARKSVSEKNNLLIGWCKVKTCKSCFINTAVSCVYKTRVKIFRDKLRLHEICLHIFFYPKEQGFFLFSVTYMLMLSSLYFRSPFSLFLSLFFFFNCCLFVCGIQIMFFRFRSSLRGLCDRQLLLLPVHTVFSTR